MKQLRHIALGVLCAVTLGACQTVKLPKFDSIKFPEFRKDFENLTKLPDVPNAPALPTELRSAEDWDNTARQVLAKRNALNPPAEYGVVKSSTEVIQDIDALKAKVKAYKADDPIDLNWGEK